MNIEGNTVTALVDPPTIDVTEHLDLARRVAGGFRRRAQWAGYSEDDLFGEACLAMMRAASSFDPSRGPWGAHATVVIRQRLCMALDRWRLLYPLPTDAEGQEKDVADPRREADPDAAAEVGHLLEKLPRRIRLAVDLRYGLDGEGPRQLWEIAELLGVSPERVRQLVARGMARMRRHVEEGDAVASAQHGGAVSA